MDNSLIFRKFSQYQPNKFYIFPNNMISENEKTFPPPNTPLVLCLVPISKSNIP